MASQLDETEGNPDILLDSNHDPSNTVRMNTSESSSSQKTGRMGALTEKLLSRANTMLRTANLSRQNTQAKPGTAQIQEAVSTLQREKTTLVMGQNHTSANGEDYDIMTSFLEEMNQGKDEKVPSHENDSDYDTDLDDETPPKPETTSVNHKMVYRKTCKKLGIRPVTFIEKSIESAELKVQNRSLNSLDLLSLTNALISNKYVTSLILDGNNIGSEGAQLIAWLLKDKNNPISILSIADNNIGPEGFQALGEVLVVNKNISSLNISGNNAGDAEIKILASALKKNFHIHVLNLSYNGIGDKAAKHLASAIAYNEGLTTLDLSWNKIRPTGAIAICHALKENVILKTLNLSMNGLSTPGALFIGETLKKNESLTYLDITYNRIFDEGAAHIAKGLQANEKLHHLIMHHNPLTSLGVMTILSSIRSNENTGMWKFDVRSIPILKDVSAAYREYQLKNDGFQFLHGIVVDSESPLEGDTNAISTRNPMAMVREYIEEEGLRLTDFFKIMDQDGGGTISREELINGLKKANVPMTQAQLDDLIDVLDVDGDGEIDYKELVDGDREFRRRMMRKKVKAIQALQKAMKLSNAMQQKEESWMK